MDTKKLRYTYFLATAICLLFLLFGISFILHTTKQNQENNKRFLNASAEKQKQTVVNHIVSNWETLEGIASFIGNTDIMETETLVPILKEINNKNAFTRMGVISFSGKADFVDITGEVYRDVDLSGESFFQQALVGAYTISDTQKDIYTDNYFNYYGVPIKNGEKTIGVLCAVNNTARIREILDAPIFNNGGYSNILNSCGNFIIRCHYEDSAYLHLEDMGSFTSEQLTAIYRDFGQRGSNFLEYEHNGKKIWGVYTPLGINDWYIISTVPKNDIDNNYSFILGMLAILGFALLIFAFFAYRMNAFTEKGREMLEYVAYMDPLTAHMNYPKFLIDAGDISDKKTGFSFWYLDIDSFKIFDDIFGYDAGDTALRYLSGLLEARAGANDLFCRLNADKFAGIRFYGDKEELVDWFTALSDIMEHYEPFPRQIYPLFLSIGFYCCEGKKESCAINDMLNKAIIAQKTVKNIKSAKYAFYTGGVKEQMLWENELEAHMKQALENREFEIYMQPKVDIQNNNSIIGAEALVRWKSPSRGLISPADFIPLFEKNGFITKLDRYVFENTCCWLHQYRNSTNCTDLKIAVNVSRIDIFQEDFLEFYTKTKEKYCLPDNTIELEFTESIALEDHEFIRSIIIALQKNGFTCSLDDFGSGYSSLNVLKDLPIDILKLDMLFFRAGKDTKKARIVISNIIHMARQLHIRTVSEGVESWEQVDFLADIGCDLVQGYVFEKPVPLCDFEKLLERNPHGFWGLAYENKDKTN